MIRGSRRIGGRAGGEHGVGSRRIGCVHGMNRGNGSLHTRAFAGRGFLMSLEAAVSLILLITAASFLHLFQLRQGSASDFFICSDAAVVLAKSHAFSDGSLQGKVETASQLSGLCIAADSPSASAFSCETPSAVEERFAFSIPIWQDGAVQSAQVRCWRGA